jgi:putative transposase
VKVKYAFMKEHASEFGLAAMCRVLEIQRSGYYAWQRLPACARTREDKRLLGLIKDAWRESGSV